jgi:hypothetical protein
MPRVGQKMQILAARELEVEKVAARLCGPKVKVIYHHARLLSRRACGRSADRDRFDTGRRRARGAKGRRAACVGATGANVMVVIYAHYRPIIDNGPKSQSRNRKEENRVLRPRIPVRGRSFQGMKQLRSCRVAFEDSSRKPPIGETARLTNRSEGFQH